MKSTARSNKFQYLYLLTVLLLCCSKTQDDHKNETATLDPEKVLKIDIKNSQEISDMNHIINVSIIRLEKKGPESIIGQIDKLIVENSRIFILDK